jgi:hypothetical protein
MIIMATKKTTTKKVEKQVKEVAKKETTKKTTRPVERTPIEVPAEAIENVPQKKQSAGATIRNLFIENLSKITSKELEILTSAERTKEILKIRYPFLKKVTGEKDERKVNGCPRYSKAEVTIENVNYFITNDLYSRNIEVFKNWIESIK